MAKMNKGMGTVLVPIPFAFARDLLKRLRLVDCFWISFFPKHDRSQSFDHVYGAVVFFVSPEPVHLGQLLFEITRTVMIDALSAFAASVYTFFHGNGRRGRHQQAR